MHCRFFQVLYSREEGKKGPAIPIVSCHKQIAWAEIKTDQGPRLKYIRDELTVCLVLTGL